MTDINHKEIGYELKISDMMKRSNRIAWTITFFSMLIGVSAVALYLYKPLVNTVPYVIKIDKDGIPSTITSLNKDKIEVSEAVDKYFIKEYVVRREQYYWNLLEKDYLFTQLLSTEKVKREYQEIYEGDNARDVRYKDKFEVKVIVKSIVLGFNAGSKNATIRIEKVLIKNRKEVKREKLVIDMVYGYNGHLKMSAKKRLENPLGFRVYTYKTEKEIE